MARKLRAPQQATVGTKTRSAGRTPPRPAEGRARRAPRASGEESRRCVDHGAQEEQMDVVVTGRHCEVSDRFRSHVNDKLVRLEKHDHRIIRVQVEVENERNPRQHDRAVRVELTAFSKGPVIRAEAAADDKMGALDLALDKMAAQMRRAADRRQTHRARGTTVTAAELALAHEQGEEARGRRRRRRPGCRAACRSDRGHRRGSARRAREDPRRQPDDARPGALRDGAGRPRLLPLRRQGERPRRRSSTGAAATTTA